ncbi:OB-fold nucleic acid binding domain-containing protein [Variovorax sp. OV329]|uniref:OB-fold nucleic acid binding domain-containing protein n=1 Tax=Variovorax sp. OV329 TaxID=1882825 RepID=UPI0034A48AA7
MDEDFLELAPALQGEEVVHDFETVGLTLRTHPIAPAPRPRPAPAAQGQRLGASEGRPGSALCRHRDLRQQPETAKAIFISLEDETGVVQVIVWKSLREQQRPEVLRSRLLAVHGKWQREGDTKNHRLSAGRHDAAIGPAGDRIARFPLRGTNPKPQRRHCLQVGWRLR